MTSATRATPSTIMVVDDTPANLRLLEQMLQSQGHRVLAFPGGRLALNAARRNAPDLILLDITMPEMNGFEVCQHLKADPELRSIPVLFISALAEVSDKVRGFEAGGVDYVTKPFQFEELRARVGTHLQLRQLQQALTLHNRQLEEQVREQVREISDSRQATIFALAKLTESRDDTTGGHIDRTQIWCRMLAEELLQRHACVGEIDEAFVENIQHAAPLHDIGKVGVPDAILMKPGRLSAREFAIMQGHAEMGARTLEEVHRQHPGNAFILMGIHIARFHHERWNGSGYPDGLRGEAIPLCARIMAVADTYDAMRARRPYKPSISHETCLQVLRDGAGKEFDPLVVEALLAIEARIKEESTRRGLDEEGDGSSCGEKA